MLLADLVAFVVAGFALVGSPGPATLSLAAAGAAFDRDSAKIYLFGILTGASLVVLGVALGVVAAVLAVPHAATVLGAVSFTYLAYLVYRIATAPPVGAENAVAPGFLTGLVFNLANPKAYAAFAALFAGYDLLPEDPMYGTTVKVLICLAILVVADIAWLTVGSTLRSHLHDPRKSRLINLSFAFLLLLSVLPIALATLR